jgi:hypothetical protein
VIPSLHTRESEEQGGGTADGRSVPPAPEKKVTRWWGTVDRVEPVPSYIQERE